MDNQETPIRSYSLKTFVSLFSRDASWGRRLIRSKRIESYKKDGRIFIPVTEVERILNRSTAREKAPDRVKNAVKELYLIKDKRNGYYKIGISVDAICRESTLASEKADYKLVGVWNYLSEYEKEWHKYFDAQHIRGEWFALTKAQIRFFCYCCRNEKGPPYRKTETEDLEE